MSSNPLPFTVEILKAPAPSRHENEKTYYEPLYDVGFESYHQALAFITAQVQRNLLYPVPNTCWRFLVFDANRDGSTPISTTDIDW